MKDYIIIQNGKINFNNMIKNELDVSSLCKYLRKKHVLNIENIEILINFYNKLYFIKKSDTPVSIVLNGKIMYINLLKIRKNLRWINHTLIKNDMKLSDILYGVYMNNRLYIIKDK